MTTFDPSVRTAHVSVVPSRGRLDRRAALDLSIDDELLRGEHRGAHLSVSVGAVLRQIVAHELDRLEPLSERALLTAGIGGIFGAPRRARRVDALVEMSLARRVDGNVRPTVAGIAAIHSASVRDDGLVSTHLLRALRHAEIDGIRR